MEHLHKVKLGKVRQVKALNLAKVNPVKAHNKFKALWVSPQAKVNLKVRATLHKEAGLLAQLLRF